jgi:hypothetical protein
MLALPAYSHVDRESVDLAISEFGRFTGDSVGHTDRIGDIEVSVLDSATGSVRTPMGFNATYGE